MFNSAMDDFCSCFNTHFMDKWNAQCTFYQSSRLYLFGIEIYGCERLREKGRVREKERERERERERECERERGREREGERKIGKSREEMIGFVLKQGIEKERDRERVRER